MTPVDDAQLLLRLVERHLGSLRGTLAAESFADEDWGFRAEQTLEKLLKAMLVLHGQEPPRSHSLQRLLQELEGCGDAISLAPELRGLDDFAVLARYDAEPTPLPANRQRLLALLDALHEELRRRVG